MEIVNQRDIDIDLFENELSMRDAWKLELWSCRKAFDFSELIELSSYFGVFKYIINNYDFNLHFGGFGREKINLKGVVIKFSEYDNNGEKPIDDYFLIKGYIKIDLGNDKGERDIAIKLKTSQEVLKFFNDFENIIKISMG